MKLMGLSLVMQSAYLQANIPQSLPFICCGISFKERTRNRLSFPEEPISHFPASKDDEVQARDLSQTSPNEAALPGRANARASKGG